MWHSLRTKGLDGIKSAVQSCLQTAVYLRDELTNIGVVCRLNDLSSTVVLERPMHDPFIKKWQLACEEDIAHVVVMPNVTTAKVGTYFVHRTSHFLLPYLLPLTSYFLFPPFSHPTGGHVRRRPQGLHRAARPDEAQACGLAARAARLQLVGQRLLNRRKQHPVIACREKELEDGRSLSVAAPLCES